ncbi:MAG TPA: molybdopterin cofactor-binding domain-containing protein [Fimbriimonadaceae bacterium]|nr:molybdopterin cofactor-binding domain-containing protein [Fimbriimonadaceae bacterium]
MEDSGKETAKGAKSAKALTRRSFLGLIGGVGASFALGSFTTLASASQPEFGPASAGAAGDPFEPNAYLRIDPDGICTITVAKSDMGQGIRTTFAMLVAEELDADWSKVRVTQAPGDRNTFGGEGTGGSSSTRTKHAMLRDIGATARAMLVAAAAKKWGVSPSECKTESGKVIGPKGQVLTYGQLTALAKSIPVPSGVPTKDKSQFKIIGTAKSRLDNHDYATGKPIYAQDISVPGAVHAVCLRSPAFRGSVAKVDDSAARKIPGVLDVIPMGDKIAVIGTNTWAALKGRDALQATWNNPTEDVSTQTLHDALAKAVGDHLPMPESAKVIDATFDLPYLAHATMEPLNAVADVREDRCEIWVGSQGPDSVQQSAARATGLPIDKVVVHNMLLGGGFGRKSGGDYPAEAVDLSKRLKKPVKLWWTRECDMQHDTYRPMSHHSLKGAVDSSGNPVGWSHQMMQAPSWARDDSWGGPGIWYAIPGAKMKQGGADTPVPTGAWRSVENTQINVVNECFIDELAHAAGKDPFEFRRNLIWDDRLKKVLETAAEKAGWGTPLPAGSGRGIACFNGYGSCIAHVVEVTVKGNDVKVDRCVAVIDVGTAVNPKGVEAQVQGAFMDGVATALKAGITIEKGGAVQSNWDTYPWARMADAPAKMEVYVMDSGADFGGMGEVGYPSSVPAIANAIFAATGKRVRKFPCKIEELV